VCWMINNKVSRPVRPTDFIVLFANLLNNVVQSVQVFTDEIYELSIYHANRKTEESYAWEQASKDLETLSEETDG